MKQNLISIEAISNGLLDGGCEVYTNFPGFMSHKLFSSLGGKTTSVNEKIAYEIAWGASFAGKRSVVTFKNVGLSDAADPFLNSMLVGVNAGLVVVVFDDVYVEGSQSRQDSRHYYDFFGGLWFEPNSIQNAYDIAYKSFELSENFGLPVVIRVTNQLVYSTGKFSRKTKRKIGKKIIKNHKQYVVHPINSQYQRESLMKKNVAVADFIEKTYGSKITKIKGTEKLLLSFGCNDEEAQDYVDKGYKKLDLNTYPIPRKIKPLIYKTKDLVVLEQGSPFAYEKVKTLLSQKNIKSDSGHIPDKSGGYIISDNYRKLFSALKTLNVATVVADLGEYTQDTLDTIDACLCFGSSLSVGVGVNMAGEKNTISIIGDAAYMHSGKNVIPEAIRRKIPIKAIVLCNGGSQGTGGQVIPGDLYYQPKGVEVLKANYKLTSLQSFEKLIKKMFKTRTPSVLYADMNK